MSVATLDELDRFKLPTLRQAGVDVERPHVVLVSRSGFARD